MKFVKFTLGDGTETADEAAERKPSTVWVWPSRVAMIEAVGAATRICFSALEEDSIMVTEAVDQVGERLTKGAVGSQGY